MKIYTLLKCIICISNMKLKLIKLLFSSKPLKIPKNQQHKTDKGSYSDEDMKKAILKVVEDESVRSVAKYIHLNHVTLSRYIKKYKNKPQDELYTTLV